ncbi:MAG: CxxC-x17-CxxC domain-containing protein [Patescibacteria group bacterium]
MYKPQRSGHSGGKKFGEKKFGGSRPSFGDRGARPSFKRDSFSGDRPESFDAVCATCGKDCRVPFRPNGRKPVYCSNCFNREDGDKPSFRDRSERSESRESRPSSGGGDNHRVEEQLRTINLKLDTIMKLLNAKLPKGDDEFDLG